MNKKEQEEEQEKMETINTLIEWQMINETEKGLKLSEEWWEGFDAVCEESEKMYPPTNTPNINRNIDIIIEEIFDGFGIDDRKCTAMLRTILRDNEKATKRLKTNLKKRQSK